MICTFFICPTAQKDECFSMEKVLPSRNLRWPWNIRFLYYKTFRSFLQHFSIAGSAWFLRHQFGHSAKVKHLARFWKYEHSLFWDGCDLSGGLHFMECFCWLWSNDSWLFPYHVPLLPLVVGCVNKCPLNLVKYTEHRHSYSECLFCSNNKCQPPYGQDWMYHTVSKESSI